MYVRYLMYTIVRTLALSGPTGVRAGEQEKSYMQTALHIDDAEPELYD